MSELRITEIFRSLQGESSTVGWPTVFIRLTGCPLRCTYCDTSYAFKGGSWMSIDNILQRVADLDARYVTVTGGEPLAQKDCPVLLTELCDKGYQVSLETSGALDVSDVDPRVMKVMDLKTPSSGEMGKNLYDNIAQLNKHDEVKFVICDDQDYRWAKQQLDSWKLTEKCDVLFSPCHEQMDATELADQILKDKLEVRFQLQLHKLLWDDAPGR
jgi:7-carboxy-7-deazaguanine synthase